MILKTATENKPLIISYITLLLIGFTFLAFNQKIDLQIKVNQYTSDSLDIIFLFITRLAEAWFTVPILIYFLIKDWKKAIFIGICYGLTALIAIIIKYYAFDINSRPFGFSSLDKFNNYHWIQNYKMPIYNSFPSGHTTTAFTFAFILSLINKNKWLSIPFVLIAGLVGFSRIFLSFHFLIDVVAGAIIGGVTSFLLYVILKKRFCLKN
tara:strand:+ start:1421 stop:2047 length:627 start_codon:yes stop_codon:yes gene_type:complete